MALHQLPSIITALSGGDIFRVSLLASFLRPGRAAGVPVEPVGQQNQKLGLFAGLSMVVAAIGLMGR